ncbi:MAG: ATP-binding protein [Candidatus Obscuribacterales bacterium]|nr:ATP-binding protein [Candidatus Obscuribacterales bacterium]
MASSISRSFSKENSLLAFLDKLKGGGKSKETTPEGYTNLPQMGVPRPFVAAAGMLPLWDLFHDDQSGLGIMVLKDGSYRACYELDGVHVSGFDEVRLGSLMNHFTGFLNAIDTSVQLTIVCHNISKREYFERHPVEVIDDDFLKYVARVVQNDEAFLLSKNFIPELKFYVTFCYRPPKQKPQKQSHIDRIISNIQDTFTNQAARQTLGSHQKNVTTLVQRANGYISQLGSCGMAGRPISATEYFRMIYTELNPKLGAEPVATLPEPVRPQTQPLPANLRRIFPDAEPATIRSQLCESRYDFGKPDYVFISDVSDELIDTIEGPQEVGKYIRTLYMNRLPERTSPLWLSPLLRLNCEWRLNIFAHKLDKDIFRKQMQRKQAQAHANTYQGVMGPRSAANQEEAEKAQEAAQIGSELYTSNMEVFNMACYFTLSGDTLEDLNRSTELVRSAAPQCRGARFIVGYHEQKALMVGSLPGMGVDFMRRGKIVRTPTLRNSFPYVHAKLGSDKGDWLGFSKETLEPVFLNPYDEKLPNALCIVFGQPGEGKSMVAQQILQMKTLAGAKGVIIDRSGSYKMLTEVYDDSAYIRLGPDGSVCINLYDLPPVGPDNKPINPAAPPESHIIKILNFHSVMLGERGEQSLNKDEKPVLMQGIQAIYKICADQGRVPFETDLVEWLKAEAAANPKSKRGETCEDLANRLSLYCRGAIFGKLFDGPTSIPLDCQLLVFDTSDLAHDKTLEAVVTLFISDFVLRRAAQHKKEQMDKGKPARFVFCIDELWRLLRYEGGKTLVEDASRTSRHLGLLFIGISQELGDLLRDDRARNLATNSAIKIILGNDPSNFDLIRDACGLTPAEMSSIAHLTRKNREYSDAFLIYHKLSRGVVKLVVPRFLYWVATTEPNTDQPMRNRMIELCNGDARWACHLLGQGITPETFTPELLMAG